jgi:capsule polysaccharide export protein KpsE/RkpR|tara:strand:+ start:259 stop:591 length:333 start_codon:yes stop_codon:yes gene_type:complete
MTSSEEERSYYAHDDLPPKPLLVSRADILDTAKQYVTQDRQNTHGKPEDSFSRIAAYWSVYLEGEVTSKDVAVMMTMLKLARLDANPTNADNWIDACGYLACGGEIAVST